MRNIPAYVYWPLLAFVLLFCVDKIFLWPRLKFLSQPDATFLFYDYKSELLDRLEEVYRAQDGRTRLAAHEGPLPVSQVRKQTFLVLGSSRLLYFDYDAYARAYPDWELFNFSAPVTAPAYYLFILERVLERGIKPDYVMVETDSFQFNAGSDAFERSNLAYSFDFRFVLKYFALLERSEVSYIIARNLFAGFKYPPHLDLIFNRLINPYEQKLQAFEKMDSFQRTHRGGGFTVIPRDTWYEHDFSRLEGTAQTTIAWLYRNYRSDDRQYEFFRRLLELAHAHDVDLVLVRPPVSRPMIDRIRSDERLAAGVDEWRRRVQAINAPYSYPLLDLQKHPEYYCNTFVDAAHMSKDCYRPLMSLVMNDYRRRHAAGARP